MVESHRTVLYSTCAWQLALALIFRTVSAQTTTSRYLSIPQSPKFELRAVWVTTVGGLDWPKSMNAEEQQRSLREIVQQVKAAHFNTIFFQARGRADAMYKSRYEPWSMNLTGQWGRDPGWDPLRFLLDEAHTEGIEVHAWFNTFIVKTGGSTISIPEHIMNIHPDWVKRVNDEWWLDPGLPQVRAYLLKVAMDIVRSYPVDGIQFDFMRYPGPKFPDDVSYQRYGEGVPRDQWRRNNINTFIAAVYDSVKAVNRMIKVGATPIGIYANIPNGNGLESFASLYQDSRSWLRDHNVDYLVPQVYWSLGTSPGNPDFETIVNDWVSNTSGRQVSIGIGAYKPDVFKQIPQLIDVCRAEGATGVSFFRLEHISQWWRVGERFLDYAIVPPMPWKDQVPPASPSGLRVEEAGEGRFSVRWSRSTHASDGDLAKRYVVYRSPSQPVDISDAANIAAIVGSADTSIVDEVLHPVSARYYYAVTALDKSNNESAPTGHASVVVSEIANLGKRVSLSNALAEHAWGGASLVMIPFETNEWSTVRLEVLDSSGAAVKDVVDDIRPAGRYVESVDVSEWLNGLYLVRLNIGNSLHTRPLRVPNEHPRFGR